MRDVNLYGISGLHEYVDAESFGLLLDNVNAKYNRAIWRNYASWGEPTDDREWKQGVKKTPIMVRASVLGTQSEKPQRSTQGWEIYGGTLPQVGHGFSIIQDDMIELRKVAKLSNLTFGEALTDCFIQNSTNMLGGVHNELSYMTLQAMSTGEIHDVAVDGYHFDFKFEIPNENFVSPDAGKEWFKYEGTGADKKLVPNADADVIEDFLTFQKYYTDTRNLGVDHWKMSKWLFDMILKHPSVKNAFLASKYGNNYMNISITEGDTTISHDPRIKVIQSELLQWMHRDMGIWPFDVIDFKSRHEEDGKPVNDAPAFDIHNMAAASRQYKPFEMKCMNSILKDRSKMGAHNDSVRTTFVENRIAVQNVWQDRPMMNIVDCELFAGPVFQNVQDYGIASVWSEA
jgi:hypothetical protein